MSTRDAAGHHERDERDERDQRGERDDRDEHDDRDLDGDGDGDADDALRPLRAVWLEMRDEEPPSGGMAALLAAARAQADAMREQHERVPWWHRMFATLKRPPVLAMASVVVLVSGAIVIGHRHEEMSQPAREPAVETMRVEAPPPPATSATPTTPTPTSPPTTPATPPLAQAGDPEPAAASGPRVEISAGAASGSTAPAERRGTTRPRKQTAVDAKLENEAAPKLAKQSSPRPTSNAAADRDGEATEAVQTDATSAGAGATEVRPHKPQPSPATVARPQPTPDAQQLVKQCEQLAAKGDCSATKLEAQKLAAIDRAAHDALVARNQAVARCLR